MPSTSIGPSEVGSYAESAISRRSVHEREGSSESITLGCEALQLTTECGLESEVVNFSPDEHSFRRDSPGPRIRLAGRLRLDSETDRSLRRTFLFSTERWCRWKEW